MDFKALEDLVNILVKKNGTELDAEIANYQKNKLEEKLKRIGKDISNFKNEVNEKRYYDEEARSKDEQKLLQRETEISALESTLNSYKEELDTFSRVIESGETKYNSLLREKKNISTELVEINREQRIAFLEGESKNTEASTVEEKLGNVYDTLCRKTFLEEEIEIQSAELLRLKETRDFIKTRIESDNYYKGLDKVRDKEELKILENEEKLIEECLKEWETNAELYGAYILDAYKSNKDFDYIREKLDYLVIGAKNELSKTQAEIEDSNIFKEMDKYVKLTEDLNEKIKTYSYIDSEKEKIIEFEIEYKDKKLSKLKEKKKVLESDISSLESLIKEITHMYEVIKKNRILLKEKLNEKQERLFNTNLKIVSDKEMKDIESLISSIKDAIETSKEEENKYIKDINKYKCELTKKTCELKEITKEIESDNTSDENNLNSLELLNDKILLLEYQNRLDSISKQKQYLYVDPEVIREEIEMLWNRKKNSNTEEKTYKKPREIITSEVIKEHEDSSSVKPEVLEIPDENIELLDF